MKAKILCFFLLIGLGAYAQPNVLTDSATNIWLHNATLNGFVISITGGPAARWFEYRLVNSSVYSAIPVTGLATNPGPFFVIVSGLSHNTGYYYRACGSNVLGVSCGADVFFVTEDSSGRPSWPPVMRTDPAEVTSIYLATLNGAVLDIGGPGEIVTRWFEKREVNESVYTLVLVSGTVANLGIYSVAIGVDPNTNYYYRACGSNAAGISCDSEVFFTTVGAPIPGQALLQVENDSVLNRGAWLCSAEDTVWFHDHSVGMITTWRWNFPGGNPSSYTFDTSNYQSTVWTIWDDEGSYTAKLIVADVQGIFNTIEVSMEIHKADISIVASSTELYIGDSILLETEGGGPGQYTWTLNDSLLARDTITNALMAHDTGTYVVEYQSYNCFDWDTVNVSAASQPTSVVESDIMPVRIYPNPVRNVLTIEGLPGKVQLLDISGKVLQTYMLLGKDNINVSKYPSGIYLISGRNMESMQITNIVIFTR